MQVTGNDAANARAKISECTELEEDESADDIPVSQARLTENSSANCDSKDETAVCDEVRAYKKQRAVNDDSAATWNKDMFCGVVAELLEGATETDSYERKVSTVSHNTSEGLRTKNKSGKLNHNCTEDRGIRYNNSACTERELKQADINIEEFSDSDEEITITRKPGQCNPNTIETQDLQYEVQIETPIEPNTNSPKIFTRTTRNMKNNKSGTRNEVMKPGVARHTTECVKHTTVRGSHHNLNSNTEQIVALFSRSNSSEYSITDCDSNSLRNAHSFDISITSKTPNTLCRSSTRKNLNLSHFKNISNGDFHSRVMLTPLPNKGDSYDSGNYISSNNHRSDPNGTRSISEARSNRVTGANACSSKHISVSSENNPSTDYKSNHTANVSESNMSLRRSCRRTAASANVEAHDTSLTDICGPETLDMDAPTLSSDPDFRPSSQEMVSSQVYYRSYYVSQFTVDTYCFSPCPCFFSNFYVLYTIRKGF